MNTRATMMKIFLLVAMTTRNGSAPDRGVTIDGRMDDEQGQLMFFVPLTELLSLFFDRLLIIFQIPFQLKTDRMI